MIAHPSSKATVVAQNRPARARWDEVHVVGLGEVSRRAVERAATENPAVTFRVLTRDPLRHGSFGLPNAHVELLGTTPGARSPLVLCLSSDEAAVLKERHEQGRSLDRGAVASGNLDLLRSRLDQVSWADRLIIVVTNPVELMCEALSRWTHSGRIYGFGMRTDLDRVGAALRHGFGATNDELRALEVTGLHMLHPIPALAGLSPALLERLDRIADEEVAEGLSRVDLPFRAAPGVVPKVYRRLRSGAAVPDGRYPKIQAAVAAITAAEFDGPRPPRARAAQHLGGLLSSLVRGEDVRVSGRSSEYPRAFVGGHLQPDTGAFRLPRLLAREAELLRADVTRFAELSRAVLS